MKRLLFSSLSSFVIFGCAQKPAPFLSNLSVFQVTSEVSLAGIYSNVRGNIDYRVTVTGNAENVLFEYLEIDSVRLPATAVRIPGGAKSTEPSFPFSLQNEAQVQFVRMLYNEDGPIVSEEIVYPKASTEHKEGGQLVGNANGKRFVLSFKKVTELPAKAHP